MKSSTWSRINNRANKLQEVAAEMAVEEEITAEEVTGADVAEEVVVAEAEEVVVVEREWRPTTQITSVSSLWDLAESMHETYCGSEGSF